MHGVLQSSPVNAVLSKAVCDNICWCVIGPVDILTAGGHSELAGCAVALHPAEPLQGLLLACPHRPQGLLAGPPPKAMLLLLYLRM